MLDRSLVRGGLSRVTPSSLLVRGVSDGAYVGSIRYLLCGSRGDGPGVGLSKTWRSVAGLRSSGGGFSTCGSRSNMAP